MIFSAGDSGRFARTSRTRSGTGRVLRPTTDERGLVGGGVSGRGKLGYEDVARRSPRFDPNPPAIQRPPPPDDGEPQPTARRTTASRLPRAVEPLEHLLPLLR